MEKAHGGDKTDAIIRFPQAGRMKLHFGNRFNNLDGRHLIILDEN
jgi:hypothetical protein